MLAAGLLVSSMDCLMCPTIRSWFGVSPSNSAFQMCQVVMRQVSHLVGPVWRCSLPLQYWSCNQPEMSVIPASPGDSFVSSLHRGTVQLKAKSIWGVVSVSPQIVHCWSSCIPLRAMFDSLVRRHAKFLIFGWMSAPYIVLQTSLWFLCAPGSVSLISLS